MRGEGGETSNVNTVLGYIMYMYNNDICLLTSRNTTNTTYRIRGNFCWCTIFVGVFNQRNLNTQKFLCNKYLSLEQA